MRLVRPGDVERPSWAVYQQEHYLGTVHAQPDGDGLWHVQSAAEQHASLDDAVRVLRRPSAWMRQRQRVAWWARAVLADPALLVVDVQTAGLDEQAWAVQFAAMDGEGRTVMNELLDPRRPITAEASALHGITRADVVGAPCFGDVLPRLAGVLDGRRCVAYNAGFDRGVLVRELLRHRATASPAGSFLERVRWEDAMGPATVAEGLWSVGTSRYRRQRLGGAYDAVDKCRVLLQRLHHLARA
ncbi:exonuclease domain-containing protein (plasmid) [Streptomyces enissocaesilis]|uniref:3'-5' exonuclease n=1 Tax=Streptomyces TaxID=1883 RepID=UPI001CBE35AB|nr:3'-5' exonuclease [Streptomyces sp. A144]UAX58404.1 3'-5' exonuclease [Streptomyces sp. A144]WDI23397.1 exonuclease domain-containing protein [Streptomyces enissocaesilis]